MITLSVIKADIGGYVGHSESHPLVLEKADEWLAIKTSWIRERLTSNDERLPYVPAVRVPGQVKVRKTAPTNSWADSPGA